MSEDDAIEWVNHHFKFKKIHSTKKEYKFRQNNPAYLRRLGYTDFKTKTLDNGIQIVIAYHPGLTGGDISVSDLFNKGYNLAKTVIYGRKDYPKDQLRILDTYGDHTFQSVRIGRTPLPSFINTALNLLTFGQFKSLLKKYGIAKLFHLFALITLHTGETIIYEKNEAINLKLVKSSYNPPNTEWIDVPLLHPDIQLKNALDNTQKTQGKDYFVYGAFNNNCQKFQIDFLQSNGLLTEPLRAFILQDVATLFKKYKYQQTIVNNVTGIGTAVDIIKKGGEHHLYTQAEAAKHQAIAKYGGISSKRSVTIKRVSVTKPLPDPINLALALIKEHSGKIKPSV
jgi:hypothetical protein